MIKMMRMTMMMREGINKQTGVFIIASPRHWHQPAALSKCKVVMMMMMMIDDNGDLMFALYCTFFLKIIRNHLFPPLHLLTTFSSKPPVTHQRACPKRFRREATLLFFPPLKTSWSSETNGCLSLAGNPKLKSKKTHSREEADQTKVLSSLPSWPSPSRAGLTVRILRYEIEKGLRAVYSWPWTTHIRWPRLCAL